ncbi:hypothetical protein OL548_21785 [Lysinibacillus sp. MHQ-1]|nr:hypothetical protein OL548_21785 [Lysinibacillus sp. MHQ-1]
MEQLYFAIAVIKKKCGNDEAIQYGRAAFFYHLPMKKNYLYVDHHFQELLQIYGHYLKETYHNINTFNHKIATMRGFVDFIFLREWIEPFDYQHILQPRKRQKEALQVLTNKQIGQMANVWPIYFQYAKNSRACMAGETQWLYCAGFDGDRV